MFFQFSSALAQGAGKGLRKRAPALPPPGAAGSPCPRGCHPGAGGVCVCDTVRVGRWGWGMLKGVWRGC